MRGTVLHFSYALCQFRSVSRLGVIACETAAGDRQIKVSPLGQRLQTAALGLVPSRVLCRVGWLAGDVACPGMKASPGSTMSIGGAHKTYLFQVSELQLLKPDV